ncbi:hypothetical protein MRX96_013514 [Rhipicephalus microplus]
MAESAHGGNKAPGATCGASWPTDFHQERPAAKSCAAETKRCHRMRIRAHLLRRRPGVFCPQWRLLRRRGSRWEAGFAQNATLSSLRCLHESATASVAGGVHSSPDLIFGQYLGP